MRTIARLLTVAFLTSVIVGALVAHEGQLFVNVASSDIGVINQSAVDVEINAGDCWTSGEGNGYPTRMWVTSEDAFGTVYVEVTKQARVDRTLERWMAGESTDAYAWCDGVAL